MIIGSFGPWGLGPLWHVAPALTGGLQNLIRAYSGAVWDSVSQLSNVIGRGQLRA